MDSPGLLSFPLPMLTALLCAVLAALVWRWDIGARRANLVFTVLFALCALQGALVGLRFGYGISGFAPLQRMLPLLLGPLIYLGFVALTLDTRDFLRRAALHIAAPLAIMMLLSFVVESLGALDVLIAVSYLIYITALARLWRAGGDALIHARMETVASLQRWMLRGVCLLLFLLVLDSAIAVDFALTGGTLAPTLISYGHVPIVLLLLAILLIAPRVADRAPAPAAKPQKDNSASAELAAALDRLMTTEQLFLDPALTVERLAKRVHCPTRDVSRAVNAAKGMNVSQYVNSFRLAHAADLLRNSRQSVKEIAETAGFLTRSNFYREFQRVYGTTPAAFRKAHAEAPEDPKME